MHQTAEFAVAERLLQEGLLTQALWDRALEISQQSDTPVLAVLTRLGMVSETTLASACANFLALPMLAGSAFPAEPRFAATLNAEFLRFKRLLPFKEDDDTVHVAMADPTDEAATAAIAFAYRKTVARHVALESDLNDWFATHNGSATLATPEAAEIGSEDLTRLEDHASDAPTIRLVSRLLMRAVDLRASDIHLEPGTRHIDVRYRIDGKLQPVETLSDHWLEHLVSRIKLMAHLDIAEKRLPQDGRIRVSVRGKEVDVRVATSPTNFGEAVVLRILGQLDVALELGALGLSDTGLRAFEHALRKPHGIILLTGPTGSGKTTTLYTAISALRGPQTKIITVEDPVEYVIPGAVQIQIKPEIGLTYPTALRSILRQDPDVIMIGEIRDRETADIAIRAALTGHLVLATLHTNTAAGAITRLVDLGLERFLISSTLVLAAAQRLIRKLCSACKQARILSTGDRSLFTDPAPACVYEPVGCDACQMRGYVGRTPIIETIHFDEARQLLIKEAASEEAIVRSLGMERNTLWQHGLQKVADGITSFTELRSVVEAEAA